MTNPLLSKEAAEIGGAAAAGAFLSMLMQPKVGWHQALIIFVSGTTFAEFFGRPLAFLFAHYSGADPIACIPIAAFSMGFSGMFLASGALVMLRNFSVNPLGALSRAWRIFRSGNDGPDKDN